MVPAVAGGKHSTLAGNSPNTTKQATHSLVDAFMRLMDTRMPLRRALLWEYSSWQIAISASNTLSLVFVKYKPGCKIAEIIRC